MDVHLGATIVFAAATSLVLILACVSIEQLLPLGRRVPLRGLFPGVVFQLTLPAFAILLALPLQALYPLVGFRPLAILPVGTWLSSLGLVGTGIWFIVTLLLVDFLTYWKHRAEHRWFWFIHAAHHAPTELHAASSYGHPLQTVTAFLFITVPMSLVPFVGPAVPVAVGLWVLWLQFFIHSPTELHFGPLRNVFVDPRYHRIHHSTDPRHFNKNFSITFSFWDRLFGTAYFPAEDEWPTVGVAGLEPPRTIGQFILFPLRFWPFLSEGSRFNQRQGE